MNRFRSHRWLGLLLTVSCGLRVWLACLGGQSFWPDEDRYASSQHAVYYLRHGQWHDAAVELLGHADHMLFRWIGLLPAVFEAVAGPHPALVAAYFGLFSVLAIYLIWAVALRAAGEGGEEEALWAAYFAACATSLFYYSRHFFPYDIALCAMLAALWLALGRGSWRNSILVGFIAGLGFLAYNGYWWLGGCVLILYSLLGDGGWRRIIHRAAAAGAGLALPILAATAMGAALGHNLVAEGSQWGALVHGDFPFGHRVIVGYLWYAEGGILVIWLGGLAYALTQVARDRHWGRMAWYAGGLGLVLGGLLFLSDVLPVFRIQGRQVRELVPFLCLSAAVGVAQFVRNRGRNRQRWAAAIALLAFGFASWNFSVPIRQVFPDGFRRLAARTVARQPGYSAYHLTYVKSLWGVRLDDAAPPYPTILQRPHPMQFRPYQYEGWDRAQRADLNRHDISMRLIGLPGRLAAADPLWRGYPGPVRFVLRFPADVAGFAEPLATSGQTGRGDIFYVRYLDDHRVVLGLDHWGVRATVSAPIAVDYARPHELVLVAGFLLPPPEKSLEEKYPELSPQRDRLLVLLDGQLVFSMAESFYPVPRQDISFGINLIGGSVVGPSFTGEMLEFGSASAAARAEALGLLTADLPARKLAADRPAGWEGAVGPLRLRLVLSSPGTAAVQPLLSVGDPETGGLFFLQREDQDHVRLGFSRRGAAPTQSAPLRIDPAATQVVDLSLGSLLPPDDSPLYAADAALRVLRQRVFVRLNGQLALNVRQKLEPEPGRVALGANLVGNTLSCLVFQGVPVQAEPLTPSDLRPVSLLSDVVRPAEGWGGYPGPIRLKVVFPPGMAGQEPLLVSGVAGAADFLYVRYVDDRHIQLGLDHWGGRGQLSGPITVLPGAEQEFVISLGSLMPPVADSIYARTPALARLRTALFVTLNGRPVFNTTLACYAAAPGQLLVGANPLGGSTAAPLFLGRTLNVERVPAAQILEALDSGSGR